MMIKKKNLEESNLTIIQKLISYIKFYNLSVRLIHLGSVSVYGAEKKYIGQFKNITENSATNPNDFYSKTKLEADNIIKGSQKKIDKYFSYTILRTTNVFSELSYSNLFRFVNYLLKKGIWFRSSKFTRYHFIHLNDVFLAIILCIKNMNISKNKVYILSDDSYQLRFHKSYSRIYKRKLYVIPLSLKLLKFIILNIPLPRKLFNFLLIIASQTKYNNYKIKKELKFKPRYSISKKINNFDEDKKKI